MFADNHLWKLLFAFLPALIYSFIIYFNDRNNIKFRTVVSYLLAGFISICFMRMILLVFPHLQDMYFTVGNGMLSLNDFTLYRSPTMASWAIYAFLQVGLFEEVTKGTAWGIMALLRKGERTQQETLFSTMFYSCMISVGFAGIENLDYFIRMPSDNIIMVRSFTAVITHMVCGLLMGYFIALSRLKRGLLKSWGYKLIGLVAAILFHGAYDFLVMTVDDIYLPVSFYNFTFDIQIYHPLLLLGLITATICGRNLLNYSLRYGLIQKKRNPSPPAK